MALPAGITTARVTYGATTDVMGNSVVVSISIMSSERLLWEPTGDYIVPFSVNVPAGEFFLPHTDQVGFADTTGLGITDWHYVANVVEIAANGASNRYTKTFRIPTGTTEMDLDRVPISATAGSAIRTPYWWDLTGGLDFPPEAVVGDLGFDSVSGDVWRYEQ